MRNLPELCSTVLDGEPVVKLKCPLCGTWGYLDNDQLHGRVSIICNTECGYHETENFSQLLPRIVGGEEKNEE